VVGRTSSRVLELFPFQPIPIPPRRFPPARKIFRRRLGCGEHAVSGVRSASAESCRNALIQSLKPLILRRSERSANRTLNAGMPDRGSAVPARLPDRRRGEPHAVFTDR
jgi:hypothetical protein